MSQSHSRYDTTFIDTSGGILTEQLVRKLREEQCSEDAVNPVTFALDGDGPGTQTEFETEVNEAWESLKERWDSLSQNNEIFSLDTSGIRDQWSIPLLKELGFDPVYQQSNLEADGVNANLSHLGWAPAGQLTASGYDSKPPILHLVQPDNGPAHTLDSGDHTGSGSSGRSPHDELQRFLNAADQQWSVVTDGLKLRVLRDYYHTYTRGYVEFDLENIFTNRNFEDFRALYRLCHASRFVEPDESEAPLEQLYQVAVSTGVKIGEDLQSNVVEALETLGNGFLNPELREELAQGDQDVADAYFQDLLRIVYRLLFLLFAEQRGMMADRGDLYTDEYSITALRDRSERHSTHRDTESDLWEGLQVTFEIVGEGTDTDRLSVTGYNGGLFDDSELTYVRDAGPDAELDTDATCPNEAMLSAIHNLTHVAQDGYQQRISYADLGVDEIGAVYESLLEFTPQYVTDVVELEERTVQSNHFYLDDRGMERKESGSYYTKPELVDELIDSALKPVVEERVDDNQSAEEQEAALLDIDVCDPACGSGAFLIAANNYLADRLAEIRSESEYPAEETIRQARRSVVQHCIYGVDLNPMAVELAKVSLWINSAVRNKPLNFLDHRIKQGNSLIGTTESLIAEGVPVDAYETSSGRDWHEGNAVRKQVRSENSDLSESGKLQAGLDWSFDSSEEYVDIAAKLDELGESTISQIEQKAALHEEFESSDGLRQDQIIHDVWTAAFYWPMDGSAGEYPSPRSIEHVRRDPPTNLDSPQDSYEKMCACARKISQRESFFHWELEFPIVFTESGGFDSVIGNPPWETLELKERQHFSYSHPKIAGADTQSKRQKLISNLQETDEEVYQKYLDATKAIERTSKYIRHSGRYKLTNSGKINLFAPFSELGLNQINPLGRSGLVLPTAIATDSTTQEFFQFIVDQKRIESLYDFENRKGIFPGIHRGEKFCLLTLSGAEISDSEIIFAFQATTIDELHDSSRRFSLTPDELKLINPNTRSCPIFRTETHAEVILEMYRNTGALKIETKEATNPWNVELWTMFNMASASSDFVEKSDLGSMDGQWNLNKCRNADEEYLPLYEAKYMYLYDHRLSTFEHTDSTNAKDSEKIPNSKKGDREKLVFPRYWIEEEIFTAKSKDGVNIGVRDITHATTNERTVVASALPQVPVGDTLNLINMDSVNDALMLLTCLNSFALDFVAKQKVSGTHMSHYITKQLPVPTPDQLAQIEYDGTPVSEVLQRKALKLVANSVDMEYLIDLTQFTNSIYDYESPGGEARCEIRNTIDAILLHVYGVSEEHLDMVFESFSQVKSRDIERYGFYKTRESIKQKYHEISDNIDIHN